MAYRRNRPVQNVHDGAGAPGLWSGPGSRLRVSAPSGDPAPGVGAIPTDVFPCGCPLWENALVTQSLTCRS